MAVEFVTKQMVPAKSRKGNTSEGIPFLSVKFRAGGTFNFISTGTIGFSTQREALLGDTLHQANKESAGLSGIWTKNLCSRSSVAQRNELQGQSWENLD